MNRRYFSRLLLPVLCFCLAGQVSGQSMPPLVAAARDGDWAALRALLDSDVDVNQAYGDGATALHWASYLDNEGAVTSLLNAGADINATNDLGVTPLWLAAENGNADLTALLLAAGADPDRALLAGETPLMTAALTGHAGVAKLLLEAGADPDRAVTRGQTALMWAAGEGHGEVVRWLVQYGANLEARTEVRDEYVKSEKEQDSSQVYKVWIKEGGYTPLMFAARSGDLASARWLVDSGADVNALSAFGLTPAIMAVHGGNVELLELLLENGADPDSDAAGHTALHAAVLRGNLAAVNVLLAHAADVNAVLKKPTPTRRQTTDYNFHDALVGGSPLWLAARFGEPAIMQALLDAGADPHPVNHVAYPAQRMGEHYVADEGEISLLMAAVGMGHRRLRVSWGTPERRAGRLAESREDLILQASRIAVAAGVDPALRNADGETALEFARARRYASVVAFLERVTPSNTDQGQ